MSYLKYIISRVSNRAINIVNHTEQSKMHKHTLWKHYTFRPNIICAVGGEKLKVFPLQAWTGPGVPGG
jgi:hypothetical protein